MYQPIKDISTFAVGELLLKVNKECPDHLVATLPKEDKAFYIVEEILADKIIMKRADVKGRGTPVYSFEEFYFTELISNGCWYMRHLKYNY
ncbi:MAG: hypothetical protein JWN76_2431 [Chitinophagaceae bacterium]|nr:hypothetical protein [Chitinophagaceae bacterium]